MESRARRGRISAPRRSGGGDESARSPNASTAPAPGLLRVSPPPTTARECRMRLPESDAAPMRMTHRHLARSLPFLRGNTLGLLGLLLLAFSGPARATSDDEGKGPTTGPRGGEKAAAPEYGSPRDTLKALYFAIDAY